MTAARFLACVLGWLGIAAIAGAGEATPIFVQTGTGRFDVAAVDAAEAHVVAAAAAEGWDVLAAPLGLPPAFSSPIFVRVIPAGHATLGSLPYRTISEAGGVVSVWLSAGMIAQPGLRHALVHGLLSRLAVSRQGATGEPVVPLWLEEACVGWWRTRVEPAQLDALKRRAARTSPPAIAALLDWPRGGPPAAELTDGAVWLLTFLQAESGPAGEWPTMLRRLLAGGDPQAMLAQSFPGRFFGVAARELWWQTGWHHARRVRTLPVLEPEESRLHLAALTRFVFAAPSGDGDQVESLRAVLGRSGEPLVRAELSRRAAELGSLIPSLHPFYRNAALSLAEALGAPADKPEAREKACALFEQDWRDGRVLEEASREVLDRYERSRAPAGTPRSG